MRRALPTAAAVAESLCRCGHGSSSGCRGRGTSPACTQFGVGEQGVFINQGVCGQESQGTKAGRVPAGGVGLPWAWTVVALAFGEGTVGWSQGAQAWPSTRWWCWAVIGVGVVAWTEECFPWCAIWSLHSFVERHTWLRCGGKASRVEDCCDHWSCAERRACLASVEPPIGVHLVVMRWLERLLVAALLDMLVAQRARWQDLRARSWRGVVVLSILFVGRVHVFCSSL